MYMFQMIPELIRYVSPRSQLAQSCKLSPAVALLTSAPIASGLSTIETAVHLLAVVQTIGSLGKTISHVTGVSLWKVALQCYSGDCPPMRRVSSCAASLKA
jgi:hypothetical protein